MRKKMNFQTLNPWLVKKTKKLMEKAEVLFAEPNTGSQKKEWVTDCLNQALDKVDVAKIPNWIEDPLKDLLVDFLIEIVWHLLYSKEDEDDE